MLFKKYYKDKSRPVISFEIFPPKTEQGLTKLKHNILPELLELSPSYITVTYGAMGSTGDKTIDIASYIKNELQAETACHLTCIGATKDNIDRVLDKIVRHKISNIVALRGDIPKDVSPDNLNTDHYAHANELVSHIRQYERENNVELGVAVAGYPEKHLEAQCIVTDIENLKNKVDAGSDIVITQLFFVNQYFYDFIDLAGKHGIQKPIIPGLMPILSARQIQRITTMCGSKIPDALKDNLDRAVSNDSEAIKIGIDQCVMQANDLLNNGVPGIHFYVLNHSEHIREIMSQLEL